MNLSQLITLESRVEGAGALLLQWSLLIGLWRQVPQEGAEPTANQRSSQTIGAFFHSFFFLILKTLIFQSSVMFSKLLTEP